MSLKVFAAAYLAALAVYGALDLLWVGVVAHDYYRRALGHLMADGVRWGAVALFYPLYAAGVVYFAARPALAAGSLKSAALAGAALGLLVYGTYDLTNLALLKRWPASTAAADIAWGVFLTAAVSAAAFLAGRAAA